MKSFALHRTRLAAAALLLGFASLALPAEEPAGKLPGATVPPSVRPSSKAAIVDMFNAGSPGAPVAPAKGDSFTIDTPADLTSLDASTREHYQAALRAYYDYRVRGFRHRGEIFDWQLTSSKVTFVIVLVLVVVGIYFSWLQFRISLQPRSPAAPASGTTAELAPVEAAVVAAVTEISAGRDGIKVSSPVLGVIILVLSLLFFYLYLVFIYPISEIL